MIFTSYGTGRAVSSEGDWLLTPLGFTKGDNLRGVIYCHGRGSLASNLANAANDQSNLIRSIAESFPVAVCDLGGIDTWGNATAQDRIASVKTWMQAQGVKAGGILLVGTSMGASAMFTYARSNPAEVAGMVGFMPVSDLDDMYQNNTGGYRAEIGTAWGVTHPTALPSGALYADAPGDLVGIPYKAWYGGADTTVLPATVTALATAIGGEAVEMPGVGHDGFASIPPNDVVAFLAANA